MVLEFETMSTRAALSKAIDLKGVVAIAKACGVSHQAVRKWERRGRLPRTEWTGETNYAERIAAAVDGAVTTEDLLAMPLSEQVDRSAA